MGAGNARNSTTAFQCKALTATTCRDTVANGSVTKTFAATALTGRKSSLDGTCADVAAKECKSSGVNTLSIYKGRKTSTDRDCAADITDRTAKCKDATTHVSTAISGTVSWTSATDSTCLADGRSATAANKLCATGLDSKKTGAVAAIDCYDKTKVCQGAVGAPSTMAGTVKVWTTGTDATCKNAAADKCRDPLTGLDAAMAATDAKSWKSATDAECTTLATGSCRCATKAAATGTTKTATN